MDEGKLQDEVYSELLNLLRGEDKAAFTAPSADAEALAEQLFQYAWHGANPLAEGRYLSSLSRRVQLMCDLAGIENASKRQSIARSVKAFAYGLAAACAAVERAEAKSEGKRKAGE